MPLGNACILVVDVHVLDARWNNVFSE